MALLLTPKRPVLPLGRWSGRAPQLVPLPAQLGLPRPRTSPSSPWSMRSFSTSEAWARKSRREKKFPFDKSHRPTVQSLDVSIKSKLLQNIDVGRRKLKCRYLPEQIEHTVNHILRLGSHEEIAELVKNYMSAGVKLQRFLHGRNLPLEESMLKMREREVRVQVETKYAEQLASEQLTREARATLEHQIDSETQKLLSRRVRSHWKPVEYDKDASWAYLLSKAAYDFATVIGVMQEIRNREPEFQPRTLFDFGSGVGTNIWAATSTFGQMTEIFAVDESPDMIDLARLILLKGKATHNLPAGTFFRMNMPESHDLQYDLVTSTHTLIDLESAKDRLEKIDQLWKKTSGFLILIEDGTNAGFQAISEARDYLIQISQQEPENPEKAYLTKGHLYAPCPHDGACPRYHEDNIPCNFDVKYKNFQTIGAIPNEVKDIVNQARFSYVVFRKGPPTLSSGLHFPRVVQQPIQKTRHLICRLCTHNAKLEEYVASKKNGDDDAPLIYRYAKKVHCGDQFLVELGEPKKGLWKLKKETKAKTESESESESQKTESESQIQGGAEGRET